MHACMAVTPYPHWLRALQLCVLCDECQVSLAARRHARQSSTAELVNVLRVWGQLAWCYGGLPGVHGATAWYVCQGLRVCAEVPL